MIYDFTNEEVRVGDGCAFVWKAPEIGGHIDDCPKGNKSETVMGEWQKPDNGGAIIIPVVVEEVTEDYVRIRLYHEVAGKFDLVYTPGQAEPLSLDIKNGNYSCGRLFKNNWNKL